uniref:Uncharacterized protein n=1 Tax=Arundo donax TaxID=35708 RepID=A0A0A8XSK9_ARUDO
MEFQGILWLKNLETVLYSRAAVSNSFHIISLTLSIYQKKSQHNQVFFEQGASLISCCMI